MEGASSGRHWTGPAAKIPQPDTEGCGYGGFGSPCAEGRPDSRFSAGQEEEPGARPQALSDPGGWRFPFQRPPSRYTVTYSLNVTVRQFAVTSVIIIFPKKGLNSLSGSSGSSWAPAGGFSAVAGAAATAAAIAGASGFT